MVNRFRLKDDAEAVSHPEGEMVLYEDHQREIERLRSLMDKMSKDARSWKTYASNLREKLVRSHYVVRELVHMRESEYRRGTLGWQVFVEGDARMRAARQILEESRDAEATRT